VGGGGFVSYFCVQFSSIVIVGCLSAARCKTLVMAGFGLWGEVV
jgi:hypothetical protein